MTDLSSIFKDLDIHFLEYLASHGIIPDRGFIKCLNPSHPDRHPSMHIIDSGVHANTAGYCFSCHAHYDILQASHVLEKKSLTGVEFFQDTLVSLCKQFNIPYEPGELNPDTMRTYQQLRAYADATNICHSSLFNTRGLDTTHPAVIHLLERGITEDSIKHFKIGGIKSFDDYIEEMNKIGWTNYDFLADIGLANKSLFNPTGIIIPINNEKGKPVGFVTRKTTMEANAKGQEKYVNSTNSNIYHKGEILYNFDTYEKEKGPLVIVEGYLDTIFVQQQGLANVVALGSTVLTDQHVNLLINRGAKNIIICLDGDDGGDRGTKLAITNMAPYKIFKMRIVELPRNEDPDTFVRKNGIEEFKNLTKDGTALSPFAWMLKQTTFEDDPLTVAQQAIPTIAAEESNITRLKMIKELARLTNVAEADIRKDVDSLVNKDSSAYLESLGEVNQFVQVTLGRRKVKDTKSILEDAVLKIKNLEKKHNFNVDTRANFEQKRKSLRDKVESGEFKYGLIAPRFNEFEKLFDGIPYTSCLTVIGGRPSAGKTCFASALCVDIVEANEDAAVFFMTIDDSTELMTFKLLAQKTGYSTSTIKRYATLDIEHKKVIDAAWDWYDSISHRLILADASEGKSTDIMESHADWFCKTYPNHKKIFLLDSLHKLQASGGSSKNKKTETVSDVSEKVKEVSQLNDLHVIATVELRKLENSKMRPRPEDVKDTVQIEYDTDILVLVHNDLHVNSDETNVFWEGTDDKGLNCLMPYLEVITWKNKITGKVAGNAYKLTKHNLQLEESKYSIIKACVAQQKTNKMAVGGNKNYGSM